MVQTVVLIRHGEAKSKEFGQTDFERELTGKGKKALAKAYPRSLALVDVTDATELWMSPATRACQTADIANETLGIATRRELSCLYEQDDEAFLQELRRSDADTVVVVGHIPFMEDMCATLCGQYLGFSTGAVAAVNTGKGIGRLAWFVQGPLA